MILQKKIKSVITTVCQPTRELLNQGRLSKVQEAGPWQQCGLRESPQFLARSKVMRMAKGRNFPSPYSFQLGTHHHPVSQGLSDHLSSAPDQIYQVLESPAEEVAQHKHSGCYFGILSEPHPTEVKKFYSLRLAKPHVSGRIYEDLEPRI